MSLYITSLNSGSNGNCYYVGNGNEAVLIDIGISCRELEKRMKRLSLDIHLVKAIFISHEHGDHICGVEATSKKYKLPVYITSACHNNSRLQLASSHVRRFSASEVISVGGLNVIPFTKRHDAADPYSFVVEGNGVNIGVMTDIGSVCEEVIYNFKRCQAAFLEANYDVKMLSNGSYPEHLKKRISGKFGHLSNDQALELFLNHRNKHMTHLLLAHLSKENNSVELVQDLFQKHSGSVEIFVATRYKETAVHTIVSRAESAQERVRRRAPGAQLKMELF